MAEKIDVAHNRISKIIKGHRGLTADTAQRLAIRFDTTPQFWMNLQSNYELSLAASENDYSSLKLRKFA